ACAELVFKTIDLAVAQASLFVAQFNIEKSKPTPTRGIAFRSRECERNSRVDRRGKPLRSIQAPGFESYVSSLLVLLLCDRLRETYVGTAGEFGHPLAGSPKVRRVATDQVRHYAINQLLVFCG